MNPRRSVHALAPLLLLALVLPLGLNLTTHPTVAQTSGAAPDAALTEARRLFDQGGRQFDDAKLTEAIESWQHALTIVQGLDAPYPEGEILYSLGRAHQSLRQYAQALRYYQQALEISRMIAFTQGEGMTLEQIGDVQVEQGQYRSALETYQQILRLDYSLTANHTSRGWNRIETVFAKIYLENQGDTPEQIETIAAFNQLMDTLQNGVEPELVGMTWRAIANAYGQQRDEVNAIRAYQRAIALFQTIDDWDAELATVERLVGLYRQARQPAAAIALYQQSLDRVRQPENPAGAAQVWAGLARLYRLTDSLAQEIESYQQILALLPADEGAEDWGHLWGSVAQYRVNTWIELGYAYERQGAADQGAAAYNSGLALAREMDDRTEELTFLRRVGAMQRQQGHYAPALERYQQALAIAQTLPPPRNGQPYTIEQVLMAGGWSTPTRNFEIETLIDLSTVYQRLGQEQAATEASQQAIALSRRLGGLEGEFVTVYQLAQIYAEHLYDYSRAIPLHQQALALAQELQDDRAKAYALLALGELYLAAGPYSKAITAYQEAIALYEIPTIEGDRLIPGTGESDMLTPVALSYQRLGQYAEAIRLYQQALTVPGSWQSSYAEEVITSHLAASYRALGQYEAALELQNQALQTVYRGTPGWNDFEEAVVLDGLGVTYQALGDYSTALAYHQQAVAIFAGQTGLTGQANPAAITALNHLGRCYQGLGDYAQAADMHRRAIAAFQRLGNRSGETAAVAALADATTALGEQPQAIALYQQALQMQRELGDRGGEQTTLTQLGRILEQQNRPELAILFYKQAVNISEEIRSGLQALPIGLQESYTNTVAETYRALANLLLQADRILEAQEVLDLLKLQELEDYHLEVRGTAETVQGLAFWQAEQSIIDHYNRHLQEQPIPTFENFIQRPEVIDWVSQLRRHARGQNLNPDQLVRLQSTLQRFGNAALLYPLILEDRLELILVTPEELVRKTVPIERGVLNGAIAHFRSDITNRTSNPLPQAQQLYQWLIAPIAAELTQADTETLLYAADGTLRYIPLAALHDGEQWLAQRLTINHITAASLLDGSPPSLAPFNILAGAFPAEGLTVDLGDRQAWFEGLPYAQAEVRNLVAAMPNTTALLSDAFNRAALEPQLNNHSIVHLATHAEFRSGHPTDSYIVLGDGDRITLADLNQWRLPQVNLVVLSACKTAVSGADLGNGEEILGFGYQIQQTGARGAIASLWYVSDGGTQVLMDSFYTALTNGYANAAALQRAQIALITSDQTVLEGSRGADYTLTDLRTGQALAPGDDLSHPYFWAPFILIGNGL